MLLEEYYQPRSSEVVYEAIDGEAVIIDLENGAYYSLEEAALYVWDSLNAGQQVSVIINNLKGKFDEPSLNIADKVKALVAALVDANLLKAVEAVMDSEQSSSSIHLPDSVDNFEIQSYSDMKDLLMLDPIHEVDEQGWPQKADHADKT